MWLKVGSFMYSLGSYFPNRETFGIVAITEFHFTGPFLIKSLGWFSIFSTFRMYGLLGSGHGLLGSNLYYQ